MRLRTHKGFIKSVCVLCAVALHANAIAGWWDDVKQNASAKWEETQRVTSAKWEETKRVTSAKWKETQRVTSAKWEETKRVTSAKWEETKQWCAEHEEQIMVAVAAATVIIAACNGQNVSPGSISPSKGYSYKASHSEEGPYRPFSAGQKAEILQQNRERNGGVLRSDISGKVLEQPGRYTKGYTPSPSEAQVDHITPRSRGGWNSAANAQVLSREENLGKSDKLE